MIGEIALGIQATSLQSKPYPYFWAEQIFPEGFYAELIENIPDISYFSCLESYPKRYHFDLTQKELARLPFTHLIFWSKVFHIFQDAHFINVLIEKFRPDLKGDQSKLYSSLHLVRDQSNYSIGPHTDCPTKVITLLFYLPFAENQKHLGTSIYIPKSRNFICKTGTHYPFRDFDLTFTAPFLPNSVFGFARSDVSFHGVEPIGEHEMERRLLIYTIWIKGGSAV